ncbi:PilZ domain-containing protein [Sphingobium subterraneum]|uniref:PilZ domain-containing protein n=1 Tax=Sphingobium subterraneum TaxID=627688 RepID=A0A841J6S5_9SPHN|nr:PilZ domain-containing protein [Sphingobium subterraneum]MBB6124235.1 hypothetical protein [Sphingobium subterraneum]
MAREKTHQAGLRVDVRWPVDVKIKLRKPMEQNVTARISDLSPTGFRLHTHNKLLLGTNLWISLPGFDSKKAIVRWTRDFEAGCQFEAAIYEPIFLHMLKVMSQTKVR